MMYTLDKIALILTVVGAINWGSIGLFNFDIVSAIFPGDLNFIARIIFTIVGLAGLWCIALVFSDTRKTVESHRS